MVEEEVLALGGTHISLSNKRSEREREREAVAVLSSSSIFTTPPFVYFFPLTNNVFLYFSFLPFLLYHTVFNVCGDRLTATQ